MKPWVHATGQLWKLVIFAVMLCIALATFVAMVAAINGTPLHSSLDQLGSVTLFLLADFVALAWLFLAIRCSACGGRPAWHLVRTAPVQSWFSLLVSSLGCPACGHTPSGAASVKAPEI